MRRSLNPVHVEIWSLEGSLVEPVTVVQQAFQRYLQNSGFQSRRGLICKY
jgi:hypothetical protein